MCVLSVCRARGFSPRQTYKCQRQAPLQAAYHSPQTLPGLQNQPYPPAQKLPPLSLVHPHVLLHREGPLIFSFLCLIAPLPSSPIHPAFLYQV